MREVRLCQLPSLCIDYHHVMDFNTIQERDNYFNSKTIHIITSPTKFDYTKQSITINKPIEDLVNVDYVVISENNNRLFYFIINKETLNSNNTIIYLKVDVWTTYMFNYELKESYVERGHQHRWDKNGNIVHNITDEGFGMSDYVQEGVESIHKYNNGIIIATTSPLGVIEDYVSPPLDELGSSSEGNIDSITPGINLDDIPDLDDYINDDELPNDGWCDISWDFDDQVKTYLMPNSNFDIMLEKGIFGAEPKIGIFLGERFITGKADKKFYEYTQCKIFKTSSNIYLILRKDNTITDIKQAYQLDMGLFEMITEKYYIDKVTQLPKKIKPNGGEMKALVRTHPLPHNCLTNNIRQIFGIFSIQFKDTNTEKNGQKIYKLEVLVNGGTYKEFRVTERELISKYYYHSLAIRNGILCVVGGSKNVIEEGFSASIALFNASAFVRQYS